MTQSGKREGKYEDVLRTYVLASLRNGGRRSITSFWNIRDSNGITWLQTRMSYHKFPNLGEILQGGLVSKLRKGLAYKDFIDR